MNEQRRILTQLEKSGWEHVRQGRHIMMRHPKSAELLAVPTSAGRGRAAKNLLTLAQRLTTRP